MDTFYQSAKKTVDLITYIKHELLSTSIMYKQSTSTKQSWIYGSTVKPHKVTRTPSYMIQQINAEFNNRTRLHISEEINAIEQDYILSKIALVTSTLFVLMTFSFLYAFTFILVAYFGWRRWSKNINSSLELWHKADEIFRRNDEAYTFDNFIELFPKDLKGTRRYKMIRRLHAGLLFGIHLPQT